MWRILLALLLMTTQAFAVTAQWRGGVGTQELDGTQNASLIGYNTYNHIVQPLDNLLSDHCTEWLQYSSSTTLIVEPGTCVVSNSQGTIRLFMLDSAATNITKSNLDTGSSFTASTTYYVYATAASNSDTASTYYISASNTAPSGATYYYQIGSFNTDSSNNIMGIVNNKWNSYVQPAVSKSSGVVYQALTDGFISVSIATNGGSSQGNLYVGTTNSPSTAGLRVQTVTNGNGSYNFDGNMGYFLKKGDYYEIVLSGIATLDWAYFVPTSK